jgi:lysyl-tRNA synthetase class 1
VPGPEPIERLAAEKGAPLDDNERDVALARIRAARAWLEHFAPESARIEVRYEALPPVATEIDGRVRAFLGALADAVEATAPASGDTWQALIFDVARAGEIRAGDAFGAIYRAFLGRANGPRAGWLLASLDRPFVLRRLREAAA